MKRNSETIIDECGIEMLVGYRYSVEPSFHAEPGNASTFVSSMVYTELDSVEVVICGVGIDILKMMSEKQKQYVITQLMYE